MQPFTVHTGVGVPLRLSNVDTDQILPSKYLKRVTRSGYEDALFAAWRQSPDFVLNDAAFAGASVLVTGPDFGTGSSREVAVWALQDYGFRAVIAPRFGDIFRTNAGKSGLVAVELAEPLVLRLWELLDASPGSSLTVDLERNVVEAGNDFTEPFTLDEYTRWRLLNGLDDIAITLESEGDIAVFEQQRSPLKPRVGSRR
ncbi:3-isopropylmalate dehydratase small subunit [Subtercola sp. Z020]|uniref:3-isopropylmalate dehydratase small subunit n=1 Tax=Subtercola sp. Z020 TaxID=2080582 RepID=UPI000CE8A442|nr:3-isopropylmalate dehydratase small subunit [Subtercola sp. Z020]PPF85651.1 3-isopropylmalate dehydratase small subunit [Subtercola sp. Z020]